MDRPVDEGELDRSRLEPLQTAKCLIATQHGGTNDHHPLPPEKNEQAVAGEKPPRLTKKKAWSKPTIGIIEDGLLKTESGASTHEPRESVSYFIPS